MPPRDDDSGTAFSPRAFRRSLRGAGITATQYRLAVELCEYASQDKPIVWPSVAVLAEDCALGRSTVKRVLGQLESMGVIVCDGGRKGGRGCSTRWRLIVKGPAGETLSDGERVSLQTKRVSLQTEKGLASGTRRREEEEKEGGEAADAATAPLLVSLDRQPQVCCPEHEPDGVEECEACLRAWRKHEAWESHHPQSWAEFVEELELFSDVREDWVAQGPPRFCERDHAMGAPCNTCRDLRLVRDEWDKRHTQWERDRHDRRKDIADCRICDNAGRVWIGDDPDPWWCDHGAPLEPLLSSFATSSVPPVNCEPVPDCLAGHAIRSQPDTLDSPDIDVSDSEDSDDDGTEEWMVWMADSETIDTAAPLHAESGQP